MNKLFLFIALIFVGCKPENNKHYDVVFDKFPSTKQLEFKDFLKIDSSNKPTYNFFVMDSSLFVLNLMNLKNNYLVYEYPINSRSLSGKYIKWGRKNGMTLAPMSYGIHNNNVFWVHDLALEKFITFNLANRQSSDSSANIRQYSLSGFSYSSAIMNNNKVLLSGFPSNTDEMLKIVDITTNNVLSKIGRIDIQNTSLPNNTWRAAYEGFLYLQPSENKAIIACRYTDEVCLFDLKTGQQKSIGGPEHFSPAFKPLKEKAMDDYSIARTGETRFAFICGAVTERYIYLLYSGKKEKEDNSRFGKDVFIYDWEGMPAKHFLLDRYASGIAISPDDKDLYIADSETGDILKSSTSTN